MNVHAIRLPSISVRPRVHTALIAVCLSLLAACVSNPVQVAETAPQKFYAAKLTYDAVLSGALDLVNDTTLPAEFRRTVQSAAVASGDVYREANRAYLRWVAARAELAAGATTSEKLTIATANLERWLDELDETAGGLAKLAAR